MPKTRCFDPSNVILPSARAQRATCGLRVFACACVCVSLLPSLVRGGGGNSTKERTLCNDDDYVNKRSVAYHPLRVNSDLSSVRFTLY